MSGSAIFFASVGLLLQQTAAHHIYMDDWLIASTDEATHVQHLGEVFRRLQAGGLVLNVEKMPVWSEVSRDTLWTLPV